MLDRQNALMCNLKWDYDYTCHMSIIVTAKKVGLDSDSVWQSNNEVMNEIKIKDKDIYDSLFNYLEAYKEWFDFCYKCHLENKTYPLQGKAYMEMFKLIVKRDKTREEWANKIP